MPGKRILTLLLLLCGLSTTPFFSLEQSPDDGLTDSSVPQCGTRILGKSFEEADSDFDDSDGALGFFGSDAPPITSAATGCTCAFPRAPVPSTASLDHPASGAERLTYHANAPPAPSDLTT